MSAIIRFRRCSASRPLRSKRSRRSTSPRAHGGARSTPTERAAAGSDRARTTSAGRGSMARALPQPVRVYRVGGSVRDELLGRPDADRDYVVVGATPEIMLASGFRPVGRDFPVFLHPDTQEEHALARTERKHGRGYRGFEFFASPDVTLEEDLERRALTINAMARGEDGALVDPYGGASDL